MSALGVCAPGGWGRADGAGGARVGCVGGTLGTGCTLRVHGVHAQGAQGALSAHSLPAQAPFSLPGWAPPWVRSPRARWSSGHTPQHRAHINPRSPVSSRAACSQAGAAPEHSTTGLLAQPRTRPSLSVVQPAAQGRPCWRSPAVLSGAGATWGALPGKAETVGLKHAQAEFIFSSKHF